MIQVYVLCGTPGSGKSTFFQKEINKGVYISSDSIREELLGDAGIQTDQSLIWRTFYQRFGQALRSGENFITLDATFISKFSRAAIISEVNKANEQLEESIYVTVVVIKTPLSLALFRNSNRDRQVPESVIIRMFNTLEKEYPTTSEGFYQVIEFDGKEWKAKPSGILRMETTVYNTNHTGRM